MQALYKLFDKITEKVAHPFSIVLATLIQLFLFIAWITTGFEKHFYEIFHILLAIVTLIIALMIETSEKADTRAIQIKLDEIIKNMPQLDNKKIGIEKKLKRGKEIR